MGDAAAETRVRESFLAALEQEEFGALGGDVYAKGFLKSYARYLGLDPEPLLARYRAEFERPDDTTARPPTAFSDPMLPLADRSRPSRGLLIGVAAVVIGLILVGVITNLGEDGGAADLAVGPEPVEPAPGASPPVVTLETETAAPTATTAGTGPTGPTGGAATPVPRVVTVAVIAASVRVRVLEGSPPVDATLEQGDTREISGTRVRVEIGDAAGVQLTVDGQPVAGVGTPGQAVEVLCESGQTTCSVRDV